MLIKICQMCLCHMDLYTWYVNLLCLMSILQMITVL